MDEWKTLPEIPTQPSQSFESCEPGWLAGRIGLLLSAFRRDDYADPIGFVKQLGMVLERYPQAVVAYVTDPLTGIQRRLKFPPSIAEVVEACDAEMAWRARVEKAKALPPAESRRPARNPSTKGDGGPGTVYADYEEAVKRHGRPFGRFEVGRQLP